MDPHNHSNLLQLYHTIREHLDFYNHKDKHKVIPFGHAVKKDEIGDKYKVEIKSVKIIPFLTSFSTFITKEVSENSYLEIIFTTNAYGNHMDPHYVTLARWNKDENKRYILKKNL